MAIPPIMANTAAGPTPCFAGSAVVQASLERTSKVYAHSSGSTPTNVADVVVDRGSLSQWKDIIADFRRVPLLLLSSSLSSSSSSSHRFSDRFVLPPHGDPFVYCKTSLLPLSVKFDDCCLVRVCQHEVSAVCFPPVTYPREYVWCSNS